MKKLLPLLSLLPLLTGCFATCNLGDTLDSIGKAVPTAVHKYGTQKVYELDGTIYMEAELAYKRIERGVLHWGIGHAYSGKGYYDKPEPGLNAPPPQQVLICMDAAKPTVVYPKDFDYKRARAMSTDELDKKDFTFRLTEELRNDWRPLSATLTGTTEELSCLPELRSRGNRMRTPLVVLLSYGIDVPLSVIGSLPFAAVGIVVLPFVLFLE